MRGEPRWVDTHCHIDRGGDLEALVRALDAGVDACVLIGTNEATSRHAIEVADTSSEPGGAWPARFASVGLHPHDASTGTAGVEALIATAVHPLDGARPPGSVVAVGECGLDYFYEHSSKDDQRQAFVEQIALAHEYDLTLVVHTRDAWNDTFAILAEAGVPERTVIHCFSGGPDEAERCLELGAYLSFSGIVTFKNANDLREAARRCPPERLLVETDSPYLSPVPHRGRPNEPAYVAIVGTFIAELLGRDPLEMASQTRTNSARAFAAEW
ncbi:MAG TPA: TatD family hydrolase [Acidimicrobiales bacterium]|nr:TatD family hydrolase [Acidimicrobiales bacterium]